MLKFVCCSISSSSIGDTDYYGEENEEDCKYDEEGCDPEEHLYEACMNNTCHHNNFRRLPIIARLPKFSNFTENKECCPGHGYLHVDLCKVSIKFEL